jgi:hypothetical protein
MIKRGVFNRKARFFADFSFDSTNKLIIIPLPANAAIHSNNSIERGVPIP